MSKNPVRLLALYLPQFHPAPENDAWWGKGFTEWTNVAKAKPLFPGHYQPHLPADLGFYDLRLPEARQAQADLAREYGIHGFVYYHYWFEGKRLLERPFNEVLASGKPDFPFCLCWANENWTRVWDGDVNHVLIRQSYSEEDDWKHFRWLANALQDKRYIRIRDKPLLLVYRASQLPDALRTTTLWRDEARELGIGELYLCRVENFEGDRGDPTTFGFDAAVEFQPDWLNLGTRLSNPTYGDHFVYNYSAFAELQLHKPDPPYKRFPCVTPSWDNSPRRQGKATILVGSNPTLYEKWLRAVIRKASQDKAGENIVFINGWNEWGEGNHLEPDLVFGRGYLEATRRALSRLGDESGDASEEHQTEETRTYIAVLEDQERRLRQDFHQLEHWAHSLERTVHEQEAVIRAYQLWVGPFIPLLSALRWLRQRFNVRKRNHAAD